MSGKAVWRSSSALWNGQRPSETLPLYTRPTDSRLREALAAIEEINEVFAALAQGADDERA